MTDNSPAVWQDEMALIKIAAKQFGVDPYFIAAIRKCENGGPGREFGVLSVPAPTYAEQLDVCCRSVRHRLNEYTADVQAAAVAVLHETPGGANVLVYSHDFIEWFSRIWAPQGAANDPTGLNANWARNVWYQYLHLVDLEHPEKDAEEDCE